MVLCYHYHMKQSGFCKHMGLTCLYCKNQVTCLWSRRPCVISLWPQLNYRQYCLYTTSLIPLCTGTLLSETFFILWNSLLSMDTRIEVLNSSNVLLFGIKVLQAGGRVSYHFLSSLATPSSHCVFSVSFCASSQVICLP